MANPVLLIRADGSTRIGTGHVMRCLALAQAWQDSGGRPIFAMSMEAPALEDRLTSEGMEVVHISAEPGSPEDAEMTADLAKKMVAGWVVADGYHFGSDYQRVIKESGLRLLFIDDNGHADHYYADIVLNQNLHANEDLYRNREPYTKLLLGTQYVLLRREFWPWRGWKRDIPEVARKVLVTLGGSDPDNVTLKVIQALQQVEQLETVVVIGGSNLHYEALLSALECKGSMDLKKDIKNMPELLTWADLAISSAGTTTWELAFMGLPSLLIILAENQVKVAEQLESLGIAMNLGQHHLLNAPGIIREVFTLLFDVDLRASMAELGRRAVDGFGAARVLNALSEGLWLRIASQEDCRVVYEWANDQDSRASSFSTHPISWKEHVQWFENKIRDPDSVLYIAQNVKSEPVGIVRFDIDGQYATISINLDRRFRGRGMAHIIINEAVENLFARRQVFGVSAFIRSHNIKSIKAFEKSGFTFVRHETIQGKEAFHYLRSLHSESS
ncbi:MAG: UDP-2,4-diacetamido-2,4,6-trideoxy-beta-L-altropyranose hydrolase [Methanosarcinales archaeon]|nr:UDP-2,4-diacetamido-2,4,6-trideoxy-beta-L-altropyranose hydrolase [Methanosarcinales archaeon]